MFTTKFNQDLFLLFFIEYSDIYKKAELFGKFVIKKEDSDDVK